MGTNLLTSAYSLEPVHLKKKDFAMLFKEGMDMRAEVQLRFMTKGPNTFIFFP